MRSLNEHAGAGHTISIPSVPLASLFSPGELMAMSKNEMKDLTDRKEKQDEEGCSESVASLYDGKPCTGTLIHARVLNSCFCDGFFFDHEYMFKCSTVQTQSAKAGQSTQCMSWKCILQISAKVFCGPLSCIWWGCRRNSKCLWERQTKMSFSCIRSEFLNPDGWSDICVWMHLYRTTVTMILMSHLNESQMEISMRNFHWKKQTCWATQEKQMISVLELSSTNYWNSVKNSHERALPVRKCQSYTSRQ